MALPQQRRKSRQRALQALYQWDIAGGDARDIDAQFRTHQDLSQADVGYFQEPKTIEFIERRLRAELPG